MAIKIQYEPEIVKRGTTRLDRVEDGDTIVIKEGIRTLGIDAPEIHFPTYNTPPAKHDKLLADLSKRLKQLRVQDGLARYLAPRLVNSAGTRHGAAGIEATEALQDMMAKRLERRSEKTGKVLTPRDLYIQVASEVFDKYGRVLAYIAPEYTRQERRQIPPAKRPTFNLEMLQAGWATSIIIYPNIPKPADLALVQAVIEKARTSPSGMWRDKKLLLGYEFRACVRLAQGKKDWITRYCVDMTTARLYEPQDYYQVLPENRIFVEPKKLDEAVQKLGLIRES